MRGGVRVGGARVDRGASGRKEEEDDRGELKRTRFCKVEHPANLSSSMDVGHTRTAWRGRRGAGAAARFRGEIGVSARSLVVLSRPRERLATIVGAYSQGSSLRDEPEREDRLGAPYVRPWLLSIPSTRYIRMTLRRYEHSAAQARMEGREEARLGRASMHRRLEAELPRAQSEARSRHASSGRSAASERAPFRAIVAGGASLKATHVGGPS